MFDDLRRQLQKLERTQTITIQLPLDDDGYFERICPSPECSTGFKVLFTDWRDKVPDEQAWCAICGYSGEPSTFSTLEQQEYINRTRPQTHSGPAQRRFSPGTAPDAESWLRLDETHV